MSAKITIQSVTFQVQIPDHLDAGTVAMAIDAIPFVKETLTGKDNSLTVTAMGGLTAQPLTLFLIEEKIKLALKFASDLAADSPEISAQ